MIIQMIMFFLIIGSVVCMGCFVTICECKRDIQMVQPDQTVQTVLPEVPPLPV